LNNQTKEEATMTSKRKILNDPRVKSVCQLTLDVLTGEQGYEIQLKQGFTFDPWADVSIQIESTLAEIWDSLNLVSDFDGTHED